MLCTDGPVTVVLPTAHSVHYLPDAVAAGDARYDTLVSLARAHAAADGTAAGGSKQACAGLEAAPEEIAGASQSGQQPAAASQDLKGGSSHRMVSLITVLRGKVQ
jgi:hypothetical protein